MTPELQRRGVAAWEAEARRLHALADQWLAIDLNIAESSGYRKAAHRAERIASAWKNHPINNPPTSPLASPEGDHHGPPGSTSQV